MAQALSTQGQGSAHIALSSTVGNLSSQPWIMGGTFIAHDLSANVQLAGANNSTQNVLRVYPDGRLSMRSAATDRISTAAGAIQAGVPFQWKIINNTATGNWELYVNNMVTPVGTFPRGTAAWGINQLARYSTTLTSEITVRDFYCSGSTYDAIWDETTAPGTGTAWLDTTSTRSLTITGATGATDSWWVSYGGVTQHQSTSGTATQAATSAADTTASNRQLKATTGNAAQSATATCTTLAINRQLKATTGNAEQSATAAANTLAINRQYHQVTGTAAQTATGSADATANNSQKKTSAGNAAQAYSVQANSAPLNSQHRQSAGQLLSVAGFIADTSWVNTVDLGEIQHRATSGSAAQVATGTADNAARNSQNRQSAGQLLSVAGFIASTSWVNSIDFGNIQHKSTSGSTIQAASANANATAINKQNRQSLGRATAEFMATATSSRVNIILQKAVYVRRVESRSITKKIYHTASRHKIGLKTQSGGDYMQELNFKQGASALLQIEHTIDNEQVSGISAARYELYGRTGQVIVTKLLGNGIEFSEGLIEIQLTEDDTAELSGSYNHQCVAKDLADLKFYPLNGAITFGATKPRL